MGDKSKIEWTDATWNPVTGCTKVSEGCRNCYMARTVPRFGQDPWEVTIHPDRIDQPIRWKKPRRIFVNSLSDLFHEDVTDRFIGKVYETMCQASQHTYQILTKRPKRMLDWISRSAYLVNDPPKNIWLGVSVENQDTADERIPLLLQTPAAVRFVSAEPLLGPIDLSMALEPFHSHDPMLNRNQSPIDWIIAGGESGPGARPCNVAWIRLIKGQCQMAQVKVFIKQLGSRPFVVEGSRDAQEWGTFGDGRIAAMDDCGWIHCMDRKGGDWKEWPEDLRVREFPQ